MNIRSKERIQSGVASGAITVVEPSGSLVASWLLRWGAVTRCEVRGRPGAGGICN